MSAVSITAALVLAGSAAVTNEGIAGVAITAGQPLYLDSATNTLKLADANASAATSQCVGVALNGASPGQPVVYVSQDADFTIGGTVVIGMVYVVGATAGQIVPITDMATGDYAAIIGTAFSTSKLSLEINSFNRASAAKT